MTEGSDTIWDLVRQASEALPEPFSRASLLNWVAQRRPTVESSSIGVHIQLATVNAKNSNNPFGNGSSMTGCPESRSAAVRVSRKVEKLRLP